MPHTYKPAEIFSRYNSLKNSIWGFIYCRLVRYEWSDPSEMGSLIIMSPFRILMLYRHEGLVQTHPLYSMEAPWLPKSESGTRSPSLHLRHRGNAFSTKSPPSFSRGIVFACLPAHSPTAQTRSKAEGEPPPAASASPQQSYGFLSPL